MNARKIPIINIRKVMIKNWGFIEYQYLRVEDKNGFDSNNSLYYNHTPKYSLVLFNLYIIKTFMIQMTIFQIN